MLRHSGSGGARCRQAGLWRCGKKEQLEARPDGTARQDGLAICLATGSGADVVVAGRLYTIVYPAVV